MLLVRMALISGQTLFKSAFILQFFRRYVRQLYDWTSNTSESGKCVMSLLYMRYTVINKRRLIDWRIPVVANLRSSEL